MNVHQKILFINLIAFYQELKAGAGKFHDLNSDSTGPFCRIYDR